MEASRLSGVPIITPVLDESIGTDLNGPSLIHVPEWLPNRLGRYYLYFAHHQGLFIRLAYADDLLGPWRVYVPGVLQLGNTSCHGHIASPDVHVDEVARKIVMYYHGPHRSLSQAGEDMLSDRLPSLEGQRSFFAHSADGLQFQSDVEVLGNSYLRVFPWRQCWYGLGMPGVFYRSRNGRTGYEEGPILFDANMRHSAVWVEGSTLHVFYSRVGDCPEHILMSRVDLEPDWRDWQASPAQSVLLPETEAEGADLEVAPSVRGAIHEPVRQFRDPGVFVEDGCSYLLYSVAGERGIGIAEIWL